LLFVCVPKTNDTVGMINSEILQKMKGKYIVNIARAEICDEAALFNSLKNGELAGYASDVWYLGPDKLDRTKPAPPSKYAFSDMNNVVLSPHCATHEYGAHERYIADAVEQCICYIRGELL
jgi:formate dehydrogenase